LAERPEINLARYREVTMDDAVLARGLIASFAESGEHALRDIEAGMAEQDFARVQRGTHTLVGAGGRKFAIIVVAEGASEQGGEASLIGESLPGQERRVGGVAQRLARAIQDRTGKECRSLVLGHLQRGGMPTGYDRLLATRFGGAAAQAVADGKWGHMVALQTPNIVTVPITEALRVAKRVDPEHDVVQTARRLGIAFGD
jgi:6-phosphofructokinase